MAKPIANDVKLRHVYAGIDRLVKFLEEYKSLFNAHTTNFIVDDQWNSVVPESLRNELLSLNDLELALLPCEDLFVLERSQHSQTDLKQTISESQQVHSQKDFSQKIESNVDQARLPSIEDACISTAGSVGYVENSMRKVHLERFMKSVYNLNLSHLDSHKGSAHQIETYSTLFDAVDHVDTDEIILVHSFDTICKELNLPLTNKSQQHIIIEGFMSVKKSYEIDILTELCAQLCRRFCVDKVIDIGSGLGYLGAHLALMHGLHVLGIDSVNDRTAAAGTRTIRLSKQWHALAKTREGEGQGQNYKATKSPKTNCGTKGSTNVNTTKKPLKNLHLFRPVTQYITPKIDLRRLYYENFNRSSLILHEPPETINHVNLLWASNDSLKSDTVIDLDSMANDIDDIKVDAGAHSVYAGAETFFDDGMLMSGLHTCGDLAPSLLRLFVTSCNTRVLCAVGCCYNLLTDVDCREQSEEFNHIDDSEVIGGFPMSSRLHGFKLNRNCKLLASHSPARVGNISQLPPISVYWRAMLQVILTDHLITEGSKGCEGKQENSTLNLHVGKVAAKCRTFDEYVRKAFDKLQIKDRMLKDEEIADYALRFAQDEQKLRAFYQLRISLAPIIEALIILDRLAFLLEQNCIEDAYIVKVFDEVKSPRCHALVAIKHQMAC